LLALSSAGLSYNIFAPDRPQESVISHLTKEYQSHEKRNILEESARIARSEIARIEDLNVENYDCLWLPGGFGVAQNLSDFAKKGIECTIDKNVKEIIEKFYTQKKKIVAICIAPVLIAKIFEGKEIELTLGSSSKDLKILKDLGMKPKACK